jgi:hypothetical protein
MGLIDRIFGSLESIGKSILDTIGSGLERVTEFAGNLIERTIDAVKAGDLEPFMGVLSELGKIMFEGFEKFNATGDNGKSVLDMLTGGILDSVGSVFEGIWSALKAVKEFAGDFFEHAPGELVRMVGCLAAAAVFFVAGDVPNGIRFALMGLDAFREGYAKVAENLDEDRRGELARHALPEGVNEALRKGDWKEYQSMEPDQFYKEHKDFAERRAAMAAPPGTTA